MKFENLITEQSLETYWEANSNKFEAIYKSMQYHPCGIWFTEGFLFCSINDMLDVDLIVESGTAWGQSTEIFANYFPNKHVITCDHGGRYGNWLETKDRLSKYNNITCIQGDSYSILPKIIEEYTDMRIAVFIDGPKDVQAIQLSNSLRKYNNIISFAFHDMTYGYIKSLLSPDSKIYHSHNLEFINKNFQYLNEKIFILDQEQTTWLPYGPAMAIELFN